MKVCLSNDSFPPLIDGVVNTVVNYATVIQKNYGDVLVATPKYPGVKDDYPFAVLRYPSINTVKLVGYRAGNPFDALAMRKLADFAPDILHCHCPMASLFLSRELRNLTGAPIILTYHTKFDIDIKRALKVGALSDAAIRAVVENIEATDEVWAVNNGAGENLKSLGYTGKLRIMPNGVDFPRGAAPREDIDAVRERYGIPAAPCDGASEISACSPVFLFVGRMMWYKGQKIILDGLKKLKAAGHGFSMVFVGDGADLEAIKKYAADAGLGGECIFTGALRDRAVLRALYSLADMLLLPSVFDNNPIVVKEAAACGTASVLVKDSSSAEGVTDGVDGLLIGEDADSMAAALLKLCADPQLSRRLGDGASEDLYCSWDERIASAVERYRELIQLKERGELPPHRAKYDRAISALSEIQIGLDKVRDYFTGTGDIF